MKKFVFIFMWLPILSFAQLATSLDTAPATGNTGPDVFTYPMDGNNEGIGVWKHSFPLPLNPSGNIPFALTIGGDGFMGDLYCLADSDNEANLNTWGCIYGKSVSGNRRGPVVYQVNKNINTDGGTGGPGCALWPDIANSDNYGNRGYMDCWAWGQNDSGFSNTINFGNRDSSGAAHRRFRILNNGKVNLPDLTGSGNAHLCIDAAGSIYRGTASGC